MPPPDGGHDFLDFTGVIGINKRKNAKENGNVLAEVIKWWRKIYPQNYYKYQISN